jgi:hypothetical protein
MLFKGTVKRHKTSYVLGGKSMTDLRSRDRFAKTVPSFLLKKKEPGELPPAYK